MEEDGSTWPPNLSECEAAKLAADKLRCLHGRYYGRGVFAAWLHPADRLFAFSWKLAVEELMTPDELRKHRQRMAEIL